MCVLENKYLSKLVTAKGQKLIVERRKALKWRFTIVMVFKLNVAADDVTFKLRGRDKFRLFHRLTKHGRCHGKYRPTQALYEINL
jgi:hypothetical protein